MVHKELEGSFREAEFLLLWWDMDDPHLRVFRLRRGSFGCFVTHTNTVLLLRMTPEFCFSVTGCFRNPFFRYCAITPLTTVTVTGCAAPTVTLPSMDFFTEVISRMTVPVVGSFTVTAPK